MKKLIELRQQKTALKNQMRSLLEKADSENRSLNDDEGKQFDELRAKADSLDTEISRLESVADEERSKPGTGIQKLSSDELRNYIVTRAFGTIEKMVAASGTAITADELIDILYKLKAKYRKNAVWVMNSGTAGTLQKLKNENGDYIWRDSLKEGAPDMLLGRPVYCLESMPDIGAGKAPLAVGDFSRGYFIVDHVTGIRTRPDNITEPGFYKVHTDKYLGGGVVDSNAIKILEMKAG